MGKNTMMKRSIREYIKRTGNEEWQASSPALHCPARRHWAGLPSGSDLAADASQGLADLLVGNVGVIFTQARFRAVFREFHGTSSIEALC